MDGEAPVLVIACGALAREIVALRKLNGWSALDIQCLPPELHNRPERIPAAVREAIGAARAHYQRIFVAYADCGTGGRLDAVLQAEQVERLPGAHCYEFFATSAAFAKLGEAEPGTFYLTDFLVRHFDRLVIAGLGIDRHPTWCRRRIPGWRTRHVRPPSASASSTKNISRGTATSPPASRPWRPAANTRCPGRRLHGVADRDLVARCPGAGRGEARS
jgi:hypothetical protein